MTATTPAAGVAVLSAPLRRPAMLVAGVAVVVFGVLAARYAGAATGGRIDVGIGAVLDPLVARYRWPVRLTVAVGSPLVVVVLAFAIAAACLWLRRPRLAVLAVLGPGLTGVATTLLKPVIDRTNGGHLAYPSGHTGGATALGILAALLVISLLRPRPAVSIAVLAAGAVGLGGAVGVAMIASNAHYPTDTLGGFCAAVVVVLGAALLIDRIAERRRD